MWSHTMPTCTLTSHHCNRYRHRHLRCRHHYVGDRKRLVYWYVPALLFTAWVWKFLESDDQGPYAIPVLRQSRKKVVLYRMEPHVRTVQSLKMRPKRRTDLKIWPSKAKNLEELDFDVRKSLAPRKSTENDENRKKIRFFFRKSFFDVKKSKFANRLKRALPKFRGDRSEVRGVQRTFEVRRRTPRRVRNETS